MRAGRGTLGNALAGSGRVLELTALATVAAIMYASLSVRIHRAFHSNGWDLGLISQVIWNTGRGRWFEYSFRNISYAGDHFQPALIIFVPVLSAWGPEGLLVSQAVLLAAAGVPLALVAAPAGRPAALGVAGAWFLSLGVAQAVSFDFHVEALTPLLLFSAWLAALRKRRWLFWALALAILTTKEDAALVVLALAWLGWSRIGRERSFVIVAVVAVAYGAFATMVVIPHFRGADLNPFAERYAYLGDSPAEAVRTAITRPDVVLDQLWRGPAAEATCLLLLGAGLLACLNWRGLPAVAVVTLPAMLSQQETQATLQLHYLLIPGAMALLVSADALRAPPGRVLQFGGLLAGAMLASAAGVWAVRSPLPPSFASDAERFRIDVHERIARDLLDEVPRDARVSAQSHLVPHLALREHIFQFPRVLDAEYVFIDDFGPKPQEDIEAGYDVCRAALPRLGFEVVQARDGLALWRKTRPAEHVAEVPIWCSGQRPGASTGTSRGGRPSVS
jgi:uncharacterized membrane protein